MAENLHSVIKELECSICFETMHDPRSLQCEHTYCKECLEECISFEGDFFIECPECRAKHAFHGEDTVSSLKAPLVLKKMLDRVQDSNSHKSRKDKEENLSPRCCPQAVEWYCWECKIYCCRTCINEHFVKSCGEFHRVKYSKKYESFTLYCNNHESFHIKGCLRCACTVCPYCRYDIHEGHNIVSIDEYASKFKTPLISKIQQMKDYNEKQANFLRGLKILSDFTEQEERAKKLVSERKMIALSRVLFMLEKVESEIMCNFTKNKLAAEKAIQNLEGRLNTMLESVKELLESFESLAGKDNLEIISQTKDILDKFYNILPDEVCVKEEKVPECTLLMKDNVGHNEFDKFSTDNMFTAISGAFANVMVRTVDENDVASQSSLVTERVANLEFNPEFTTLCSLEESHKYITQYLKKIGFNIADGVNSGNELSQDKAKAKKDKKVKSLEKKISNLEVGQGGGLRCGDTIALLRKDIAQLFDDKLNKKISFDGFGDEMKKKFHRKFSVAMYRASCLASLLNSLGEGFVKVVGDGDDRKIILGPIGKFYCRCIRLMKQCDGAIVLDRFQSTYEEVLKVELKLDKFNCLDVESLIKRFPEQLKVYGDTVKVVVWMEKLLRNPSTAACSEKEQKGDSSSSQTYSTECISHVKVCQNDASEVIELVTEPNNTLLLSTLQSQFYGAVGLKYQSTTGGYRGVRQVDNFLSPPNEGWEAYKFYVNFREQRAQKSDNDSDASDASEQSSHSSIDAGEKKGNRSRRQQRGRGRDSRSSGLARAQSGDLQDEDSEADIELKNAGRGGNNSRRFRGRPPRRGGRGRGRGGTDGHQSTFRDQQRGLQHGQQGERAHILPTPLFQAHQRPSSASSFPNLSSSDFTCYKCGKEGHTVRNCPLNF